MQQRSNTDSDDDDNDEILPCLDRQEGAINALSLSSLCKQDNKRKQKKKSLDDLQQRVSQLYDIFEHHGLFVPLPDSTDSQRKTWSNRNYGADKKRQRKNAQRDLLQARIQQLEHCLKNEHNINADEIVSWETRKALSPILVPPANSSRNYIDDWANSLRDSSS